MANQSFDRSFTGIRSESAGTRGEIRLYERAIDDFLDFLCSVANEHKIYFRWRLFLPDAGDEFVLELAIAAGADYIVTYNKKDFGGARAFGVGVFTPFEFLQILGEIK